MAFPDEGVYYIKCVVDGVDVYANTIGLDYVLSGSEVKFQKWRLEYIESYEGENERACTLSQVDGVGAGYLSAAAVQNNERVRRLIRPQLWYLATQEGGVRIYQFLDSVGLPFAWKFNEEGELLSEITLSNNIDRQSWEFEPA